MGTRALAVLLLAPSLALAQTAGQVTLTVTDRTTFDKTQVNRAECGSTATSLSIQFLPSMASGATFAAGSDWYRIFASTSACVGTQPSSGLLAEQLASGNASVQTVNASGDALRAALGFSCTQAGDSTYYLCVYLTDNAKATVKGTAASAALTFQMAVPPAPAVSGQPANGAVNVTVTPGTTTATATATAGITYQAQASATGQPTVTAPSPPTSSTSFRLDNLANNVDYTVVAWAFSSAGNQSGPSVPPALVRPLPFVSFWEAYQADGGREQGGCGGGAGPLSALALLPLALRRRRR